MGFWKTKHGYRVYCGVDEAGKQIRKRCKTIEDARRILATFRQKKGRYDLDILALPEKVKIEIYNVLLRCQELGVSLSDLLDFYCEKNGKTAESKTCKECADLYLENMKAANRRKASIVTMSYFFKRFFSDDLPISALTVDDLERKMKAYSTHPVSMLNWKRNASALFNFCQKKGLCERNPAEDLVIPAIEKERPDILSIGQIKTFLSQASGDVLIYFVISVFCGLRPAEYKRLKKSSIDLDKRIIKVDSDIAKTRAFRNVAIPDVALEWLKKHGIHLTTNLTRLTVTLRDILGLTEWPHDVLRHTAASYMLARDKSADAVALQLGNSPNILHRHYKNLVTDAEASEFWALTPEAVGR